MTGLMLSELADEARGIQVLGEDVRVQAVQHDSRLVESGDLFAAIRGANFDGATFAGDAIGRGAAAIMTERPISQDVPQLVVTDLRAELGWVSERVFGFPTRALSVVGITGTNGKTTTAHLVESILIHVGRSAALMGTVENRIAGRRQAATHTTPEGDDISRYAKAAVDGGATDLVMEVSSHGLALHRVDAVRFEVGAFTNLSQDHLDYHGSMRSYGDAKARLFRELSPQHGVFNICDEFGAALAEEFQGSRIRVGIDANDAEINATDVAFSKDGIKASIRSVFGEGVLESPLVGPHNLENVLVALGCVLALGVDLEDALVALRRAEGSPGRFERILDPRGATVLVDYAHTPDALRRALVALRPFTKGRLIVVFGAGGDRDKGKRAPMGVEAATHADLSIATSDNPRSESPAAVLADIEEGFKEAGLARVAEDALPTAPRGYWIEEDRGRGIDAAVAALGPDDTLLVAGKGHEVTQVIGGRAYPFDDRERVRQALQRRGSV